MLVLDLKWVLFGLLVLLVATAAAAVLLERGRQARPRRSAPLALGELWPVWERAPLGLLVLEELRTCRYANPYARRLLGLDPASSKLPEADWVQLLDDDRIAARKEMATTGRYRSVGLGAEHYVRWWVTAWHEWDLILLFDVSASQRAEQSTHSLLSDLSHELRTPLATLLTHLEVLRLPHISPEIRQQSTQLMRLETQRMTRMVHNLLELSRLETSAEIERRPLDLAALVDEVMTQMTPQAQEQQIALSLQANTPLPLAVGDTDGLKQVFLNLLDNAVKYSRPGDRVVISLQLDSAQAGIACAVCDSGPGIQAEHLPQITHRFYRASSEAVTGSGLGLALVEEILRRHQSRLQIESRSEGKDTGTCVRFVLPALTVTPEGVEA